MIDPCRNLVLLGVAHLGHLGLGLWPRIANLHCRSASLASSHCIFPLPSSSRSLPYMLRTLYSTTHPYLTTISHLSPWRRLRERQQPTTTTSLNQVINHSGLRK
jgi:hypothetical protein